MGNIFAGSEIVEIGIQIEKNGMDFYNTLVNQRKASKAKAVFEYLAKEEEKHIAVFQNLLDSVNKYDPPESFPGEYFSYMNTLASEHVFAQKGQGVNTAKNVTNDKDAIKLGIGFEKDSIVFYEGMKKVIPEDDCKVIDAIIKQEQNHLKQLIELKEAL